MEVSALPRITLPFTLCITDDDLSWGVHDSCNGCPTVLALRRLFPKGAISVQEEGAFLYGYGFVVYFPPALRLWISRYDESLYNDAIQVASAEFEIVDGTPT